MKFMHLYLKDFLNTNNDSVCKQRMTVAYDEVEGKLGLSFQHSKDMFVKSIGRQLAMGKMNIPAPKGLNKHNLFKYLVLLSDSNHGYFPNSWRKLIKK